MTDDIVARLREKVEASKIYDDDEELLDEAADEIAELRAVLREFFTSGDFDIVTTGNDEATQAWIERAHAALAGRPADD